MERGRQVRRPLDLPDGDAGSRLPAGVGAVSWFNVTWQDLLQGGLDLPTGGRPLA